MAFDNTAVTLGLGFTGKPMANLEVGGNLSFMDDRSEYAQTLDAGAGGEAAALLAATGGLPDTVFRQTTLKLFGRYTLDKLSSIRVDLAHQRTRWTDWAWGYNGVPVHLLRRHHDRAQAHAERHLHRRDVRAPLAVNAWAAKRVIGRFACHPDGRPPQHFPIPRRRPAALDFCQRQALWPDCTMYPSTRSFL